MNATEVIRRDHGTIEELFNQLEDAEQEDTKDIEEALFGALKAHESMEDAHFYPLLDELMDGEEVYEQLRREQKVLEAETITVEALPMGRKAALLMAMPKVLEHAQKEEEYVLTRVSEILTEEDHESLGERMGPDSAAEWLGQNQAPYEDDIA